MMFGDVAELFIMEIRQFGNYWSVQFTDGWIVDDSWNFWYRWRNEKQFIEYMIYKIYNKNRNTINKSTVFTWIIQIAF